ncbi:MAG TPA: hypothetical protein VJS69_03680, partial [Candidatus Krumholzibacteria bacterium]|nr:hypothetical protein [Candidatus Krumholzibacteria bacterium]
MLFVCLSHFAGAFLAPENNPALSPAMRWCGAMAGTVSMIASPSFIGVSGIVVGCLCRVNPAGMPSLRRKLIDRGLFLLLIGHFLLAYPGYVHFHDTSAFKFEMITDAIAVLIIVGPSLVMWTSARTRLVIGALLLLVSWSVSYLWEPRSHFGLLLTRYAFGVASEGTASGFPFMPWLGVYMLATTFGDRLIDHTRTAEARLNGNVLLRPGIIAVSVGVVITIARHAISAWAPSFAHEHAMLLGFFAVGRKFPPGPGYLLLFGGAGMLLIAKTFTSARNGLWPALTRPLSAIGRASFFVFILQGYVYVLALPAMVMPYPQLWPVYYAASIVVLFAAASAWNSFD